MLASQGKLIYIKLPYGGDQDMEGKSNLKTHGGIGNPDHDSVHKPVVTYILHQ
jgi:hypothetical protein